MVAVKQNQYTVKLFNSDGHFFFSGTVFAKNVDDAIRIVKSKATKEYGILGKGVAAQTQRANPKKNNPMNAYSLVMYKRGDYFPNVKILARSNDYDRLEDKAEKAQLKNVEYRDATGNQVVERIYQVVRTQDLIDAKKRNGVIKFVAIKHNPNKEKPYRVFAHVQTDGEGRTRSQSNTVWAINKKEAEKHFREIFKRQGHKVVNVRSVNELEFKNPKPVSVKRAVIKPKQNPTVTDFKNNQKNKLHKLAAMFQGKANGQLRRTLESDFTPNNKYRLGHLVQIKVKEGNETTAINFDGESYLAADAKNNLYIVGKDARLEGVHLPKKHCLQYIGKLIQVDYVTAKSHIEDGKTVRFYHRLGEATKEYPSVFVDHDGFLLIHGGSYDIWNVGIVN